MNEKIDIPVWEKYTLTIEEASRYFTIGQNKLRRLVEENRHGDWMNGAITCGWNRKSKECYDEHRENISNRDNVVPCLDTITEIVERKIHLFKNMDGE